MISLCSFSFSIALRGITFGSSLRILLTDNAQFLFEDTRFESLDNRQVHLIEQPVVNSALEIIVLLVERRVRRAGSKSLSWYLHCIQSDPLIIAWTYVKRSPDVIWKRAPTVLVSHPFDCHRGIASASETKLLVMFALGDRLCSGTPRSMADMVVL